MPTRISIGCRRRACGFLRSMGRGGGPTWRCSSSSKQILADEPIDVFNEGHHARDFTYIDDIVEAVVRVADRVPGSRSQLVRREPRPRHRRSAPYRLYNIGNHNPVQLMDFIAAIEKALGREAKKNFLPLQPGDVPGDLRRRDRSRGRCWLLAQHADRRGHRQVRRLVPRLLQGLTAVNLVGAGP